MKRIGYACKWLDDASEVKGMKVNTAMITVDSGLAVYNFILPAHSK